MGFCSKTPQLIEWTSQFGAEYTERNQMTPEQVDQLSLRQVGIRRSDLYRQFLKGLRIRRVLEVGCNIGNQLRILATVGDYDLIGIDVQFVALQRGAKVFPPVSFVAASGFEIPFRDDSFDLVFTSGVLIHIAPHDLPIIMNEIVRCSARFIMGCEYYSRTLQAVTYRGRDGLLWKMDFKHEYCRLFPYLRVLKHRLLENMAYGPKGLLDQVFLLQKGEK